MNHKCKVCGEPAAGFHFGAFTCEGCKSFFGRAHTNPTAAAVNECKTGGGRCVIDKQNRTSCKACRLKKCLAAGMSKSGSRYGRRSNWFKIHCLLQLQQQRGRPADGERRDAVVGPPRSAFAPLQAPPPWPLFFGSAPPNRGRARDLPLSERPAFGDGDHDRPVDLTVRQKFIDGSDDDDATTEKRSAKRRSFSPPAQHRDPEPLDLTRTNGCSKLLPGIRSGCRMISREF